MELTKIREILAGIKVPVEVKRQAWIEYGRLLAACPYTQRNQIGKWVAEQGLDFVDNYEDRSAAKRLFNYGINDIIKLDGCTVTHPRAVIEWLRKTGQIESKPRQPKQAAEPAKQEEVKPAKIVAPLTEEKFELNEIVPSGRMTEWRIRTSKAARSPVLQSNIKNRLTVARDMFEIECDEDSSDQISQTVVDAITSIDEDPMFIAIVLKSLADRIYNDTLEQSKKKHLKSKSTKETV